MGGLTWWRLKKWRWHVLVLLTIVPVLIGVGLLQLLGPIGDPLSRDEFTIFKKALSPEPFLAGMLTLVGVLSIHVCVCLCGIGVALGMLRRHKDERPGFLGFSLLCVAGVIVTLLLLERVRSGGHPILMVYQISYDFYAQLYHDTGAADSLLNPRFAGISALQWAVLIPTLIGIVGVGITSAAAAAELRALPEPPPLPDPHYEAKLKNAQGRLKRLLYVLTIGLVTSTIAVSLFFHLPAKLAENSGGRAAPALTYEAIGGLNKADLELATARAAASDKIAARDAAELAAIRLKIDDFGGEVSIFWGALFTLILLATGAVPLLLLQRDVRIYAENSRDAEAIEAAQKRLGDSGLLSSGLDQVKMLGAVIAPLASGPIASFVQVAISN
jgi:hypothetical protein